MENRIHLNLSQAGRLQLGDIVHTDKDGKTTISRLKSIHDKTQHSEKKRG